MSVCVCVCVCVCACVCFLCCRFLTTNLLQKELMEIVFADIKILFIMSLNYFSETKTNYALYPLFTASIIFFYT